MEQERKRRCQTIKISIVGQVALFFLIGVIFTALLAYATLKHISNLTVTQQKEERTAEISRDVILTVQDFPAWRWLLDYWHDHAMELDIEYDTEAQTAEKARQFSSRNPGFLLEKASEQDVLLLPPEEQAVFAEIAYNRMLVRINRIKTAFDVAYLYCFSADADYGSGMFLFSGSDGSLRRGYNYEDAYKLGVTVDVTESQRQGMMLAEQNTDYMASSGNYLDRYIYMGKLDGRNVLIGMTFNLSSIMQEVNRQTGRGVFVFVAFQIVLSLLCLALIGAFVLLPLRKVQQSVRDYKDAKNSSAVARALGEVRSRNELGALATDVSDMVKEIDAYLNQIRSITAEQERISAELNVATQIQADMLPSTFPAFPGRREFDIYATMDPAKEVGGDFYDFFLVDGDHLALVIADVSGKSVPGALFMAISKALIKNRALMGGSPSEILRDVNNQLCECNNAELFVTVWFAIVDLRTGRGLAANAGHEHPALRRAGGQFELVKYRHSPALATMEGLRFREHEFELNPGDRIFVYTDGVPEATDLTPALFGDERMLAALNRAPDAAPPELLGNVKGAIDAFVGEAVQFDDITMLCFDYFGPEEREIDGKTETQ
ncbi:MAG: PP2C family protein-serine/threonine phosphatase [Oscillospiraceae bacterium]|nr:PP2C family protein-serine/threonine phosphatase [Oscillospiraceae bacterium]